MKTINIEFNRLCDEIDYWKDRSDHFEELYKEEIALNAKRTNEGLKMAEKGVANALMFTLCVTDDKEGNLVIKNEDRKILAENYTNE